MGRRNLAGGHRNGSNSRSDRAGQPPTETSHDSLYTLAHEARHAMHSYYSRRHQPYVDHDYTIFVAEVASTFNEALLSRHLLERYREDAGMRQHILNREIDSIRATLFRQTMFAEFELVVHRLAEANQALTLETMTQAY